MRKEKGFTLVELLVVISIIALLVSILLPALNNARRKALTVTCLSQQRSLILAWTVYAGENDDHLVRGRAKGGYDWVYFPQDEMGVPEILDYKNEQRGIEQGKLFRYLNDLDVYRCPAATGDYVGIYDESFRSYSIAGSMNGSHYFFRKGSNVKRPSERYVFVEQDIDPHRIDFGGSWHISLPGSFFDGLWLSNVGFFHKDRSTLSFADGHGEIRIWEDKRTLEIKGFWSGLDSKDLHLDNPDYIYMQRGYAYDYNKTPF